MTQAFLPVEPGRDLMTRLDSAIVLKRFFYLERALVVACAGWVPAVHRLESKEVLARCAWQNAMTADALRTRVLELRYPDRSLEVGEERALVALFAAALHAPDAAALLQASAEVLVPALRDVYDSYLRSSDEIADGPTRRFLEVALAEKSQQVRALRAAAEIERRLEPGGAAAARTWVDNLRATLAQLGGVRLEPPRPDVSVDEVIPPGAPFALAQDPARDERYFRCSFYWPDALDPSFPYGHGLRLQVRSAVSHLNEVWAVETAGAILQGLSASLGWEFVFDAARWLYDESRHMTMGRHRLEWWGLEPSAIPLGSYIYEACEGQDPVYRLGMLAFFETRNIGKKRTRAEELGALGDRTSERDMDFDWADEAIHAGYGRRWLRRALETRGDDPESWPAVVRRCEELVAERVARATEREKQEIRACAEALIGRAEQVARTLTPREA